MRNYFSHDYYSRHDPKLVNLFRKHGLNGMGAYWCIVEMLYEENGFLPLTECERITFELRTDCDMIIFMIHDSNLFENDGEKFWSKTAIDRLKIRSEKSNKARESADKRWNKKNNAFALQTQSECNAIKENKKKENILINNTWKTDFNIYKEQLRLEYVNLVNDSEFMKQQEKYYPNVDIQLSIEKACNNYWATEAGWKKKKLTKANDIDWKSTLTNAINLNKVYKNERTR